MQRKSMTEWQDFLFSELGLGSNLFRTGEDSFIENQFGYMELPLAVVGPVRILDDNSKSWFGEFYLPMVTTEKCLVASCQRGAKLLSENGISVDVVNLGINRACVLKCASETGARQVGKFIEDNFEAVKKVAESVSNHLILKELSYKVDGPYLHVMLIADTGEAMGMNMITIAMKKVIDDFILPMAPLSTDLIAESGNWCTDKKPSGIVAKNGRGRRVVAEGYLYDWQLESFGVTRKHFLELNSAKLVSGSKCAESLSSNAHHANMVAAFYAATGQDLAHTVEGSLGSTSISEDGAGVKIRVEMPAILVGTVGGGTALPQVQMLMKMMKVDPGQSDSADKLAALLGALVICGETSLLLALAEGKLASSHSKYR